VGLVLGEEPHQMSAARHQREVQQLVSDGSDDGPRAWKPAGRAYVARPRQAGRRGEMMPRTTSTRGHAVRDCVRMKSEVPNDEVGRCFSTPPTPPAVFTKDEEPR
jgi:hypothetical protein